MSRRTVVALLALGGALTLVASALPWVRLRLDSDLGTQAVAVSGASLVPLAPAAGVVALAGCLAVLTAGRWGRRLVGALVVLVGTVALVQTVVTALRLVARARSWWAVEVGVGPAASAAAATTAWPWLAVLGLLVTVTAGVLVLARGSTWSGLSRRYDAPAAATGGDAWTALDRGEDPTLDPGDGASADPGAPPAADQPGP
jgi:uncharacterized membrane protein (TIGR02234 family)